MVTVIIVAAAAAVAVVVAAVIAAAAVVAPAVVAAAPSDRTAASEIPSPEHKLTGPLYILTVFLPPDISYAASSFLCGLTVVQGSFILLF